MGGHGGARYKTYAVSLLSVYFEWKYGGDSTRVSSDSNVGLLLGAMGGDLLSVGSGNLGDAYAVSGWYQDVQGIRRDNKKQLTGEVYFPLRLHLNGYRKHLKGILLNGFGLGTQGILRRRAC